MNKPVIDTDLTGAMIDPASVLDDPGLDATAVTDTATQEASETVSQNLAEQESTRAFTLDLTRDELDGWRSLEAIGASTEKGIPVGIEGDKTVEPGISWHSDAFGRSDISDSFAMGDRPDMPISLAMPFGFSVQTHETVWPFGGLSLHMTGQARPFPEFVPDRDEKTEASADNSHAKNSGAVAPGHDVLIATPSDTMVVPEPNSIAPSPYIAASSPTPSKVTSIDYTGPTIFFEYNASTGATPVNGTYLGDVAIDADTNDPDILISNTAYYNGTNITNPIGLGTYHDSEGKLRFYLYAKNWSDPVWNYESYSTSTKYFDFTVFNPDRSSPYARPYVTEQISFKIVNVDEKPTLIFGQSSTPIVEGGSNGFAVGSFDGQTFEGGSGMPTFSILNDTGAFEIVSNQYGIPELRVKNGALIDYENPSTYTVTLAATSPSVSGGTLTTYKTVVLNVQNVNENVPVIMGASDPSYHHYFDIDDSGAPSQIQLFKGVSIADGTDKDTITVTIKIDNPAKGAITNVGAGTWDAQSGTYTIHGTQAAVTQAVQALLFVPTQRPNDPYGSGVPVSFTMTASDGYATDTNSNFNVIIDAQNRAPNSTIFYNEYGSQAYIQQHADDGAFIGQLIATDSNGDAIVNYEIVNNPANHFAVHDYGVVNGQEFFGLVANGPIDYAAEDLIWGDGPPHYVVTVRAYDIHGAPGELSELYVYVNGNLAPDSLTFQDGSVATSVLEQQDGAVLGSLKIHDPESELNSGLPYTIAIAPDGDPTGRFQVVGDQVNGYQLKLKDGVSLDYETLPDGAKFYAITLRVTDDKGATYDQVFTINVADVSPDWANQSPDSLTFADGTTAASVAENMRGAPIGVLLGHDPDSYDPPSSLHFAITPDGDPSGRFEVVDGVLKLKDGVALDYDSLPSGATFYTVTVRVTDGLGAYKDQVLTINVTDDPADPAPNHDPDSLTFDNGALEAQIAAGIQAAQAGILLGHDPDAFDDGQLFYELLSDASGNFIVEGNVLRLKDDVTLTETGAAYTVTIRVWDGHGGYKDQDFTIHSGRDIDNIYNIHTQADIDAIVEPTDPSGGNDKAYVYLDSFVLSDTLGIETIEAGSTVDHGISLTGNVFANTIVGGIGNDTLSGGGVTGPVSETNHDVLSGGAADDTYIVSQDGVVIEEAQDGGTNDLVVLQDIAFTDGVSYTLADNVEGLDAVGTTGEVRLVGNDGDNMIFGNASADTLEGGDGSDTLNGVQGNAPDVLIGGAGSDTYFIKNVGDVIVEDTSNELDTAQVFVGDYHLAGDAQVEVLKAGIGYGGPVHLVGNAYSYQILGGNFADTLDGGARGMGIVHALNGGAGDDTYYIVNTLDEILGEAVGNDTTTNGMFDVANLYRGLYADKAAVDAAVDHYHRQGIETVNVLDGLPQGIDDDTYDVMTQDDALNYPDGESPDPVIGGHDTAIVHIDDYTLGAGIGIETLEAGADVSAITLTGNDLANTIIGSGGNDTLDGGGTANELDAGLHDVLHGGSGDDTYIVGQDGVVIEELAGEGIDTVKLGETFGSAIYTLADNVENLDGSDTTSAVFQLVGNNLDNLIVGNADSDLLEGGSGNDTLDGGAGSANSDFLKGGDGDDLYLVHRSGDTVAETNADGSASTGHDTVRLDGVAFNATWNSYTLATDVEDLNAGLSTGQVTLTGNDLDNVILGNSSANTLDGGRGNDTLDGGAGTDMLNGGLGDDLIIVHGKDDVVVEMVGGGHDTVAVRADEYHLAADAEVEVLKVDEGYASGVILEGNAYSATMMGGAGSDVLNGGFAGKDLAHSLNGGGGNDVYYIVNAADEIQGELVGADGTANGAQDIVVLYRGLYADDTALQDAIDHYLGKGIELYEVRDGVPTAGPNTAPIFDIADDELTSTTAATGGLAHPFGGITLSDTDGDSITLTVTFHDADGVLNNVTSTGGVTVSVNPVDADGNRTYTFRGSAADLQTFLADVTFNPEDRAQGGDVTTDFSFTVRDDFHGAVVPPEAAQVVSTINDKPAFGIEEGQDTFTTDANTGHANPFVGVNLGDAENNPISLKIAFADADGALGGIASTALVTVEDNGLNGANHVYTLTGAASDLQSFLDDVTFDPTDRTTGGDMTTGFTLSVKDAYHEWEDHTGAVSVTSTVDDTNAPPTDIALSQNSFREFPSLSTFVGNLSVNASGDFVYKIVVKDELGNETLVDSDGEFKIDNTSVDGPKLVTDTRDFDFESQRNYGIKIRVMETGHTDPSEWHLDEDFSIAVRDWQGENITLAADAPGKLMLGGLGGDTLIGGAGDDTLAGGAGRDRLQGKGGNDVFRFDRAATALAHRDTVVDFVSGEDIIELSNGMFKVGSSGHLSAARYVEGTAATTVGQRIIYDPGVGKLYYDADGSNPGAKIEIASFLNKPAHFALTDFDLIA